MPPHSTPSSSGDEILFHIQPENLPHLQLVLEDRLLVSLQNFEINIRVKLTP